MNLKKLLNEYNVNLGRYCLAGELDNPLIYEDEIRKIEKRMYEIKEELKKNNIGFTLDELANGFLVEYRIARLEKYDY